MRVLRKLNEFKELIFGLVAIGLVSYDLWRYGQVPLSLYLLLRYVVFFILLALSTLFDKVARRRREIDNAIRELERDLSRDRRRCVVAVRNAPLPNLIERLSDAVRDKDWWDWSYVGLDVNRNRFCAALFDELEEVYLKDAQADQIKTSSLTYLTNYPFLDRTFVFTGDVVLPRGKGQPDDFPDNLWAAEESEALVADFRKLYVIRSAWNATEGRCLLRSISIKRDQTVIERKWRNIYKSIRLQLRDAPSLVWKSGSPAAKQRSEFRETVQGDLAPVCPSSLFVVSPFSGGCRSVARVGFSSRVSAGILLGAGWLLSPLSFFNDFYVNIPLAVAIAYFLSGFFGRSKFPFLTGFAYVLTNLLGLLLIFVGLRLIARAPRWRLPPARTLLMATVFLALSCAVALIISRFLVTPWGPLWLANRLQSP